MTYYKYCKRCKTKTEHEDDVYENLTQMNCLRCGLENIHQTKEQQQKDADYAWSLIDVGW